MSKVNELVVRLVDIYADPDISEKEFGSICKKTSATLKRTSLCSIDADFRDVKRAFTEVVDTLSERANFQTAHRVEDIIGLL